MNRRARRIHAARGRGDGLSWGKVLPQGTYAELGAGDARDLLVRVFRAVASEVSDEVFADEVLFDSTMLLIKHGLLSIWFAFDGTNVHVRSEVTQPSGGAA